jgi:ribosomal protein S21
MAIEIKRKPKESVASLIRRFNLAVLKSGILLEARKRMYKDRNLSPRKKWEKALYRLKKSEEYEKLKKWGKI